MPGITGMKRPRASPGRWDIYGGRGRRSVSLGSDDPMTTTNDLMACAHCALFYRRQDEYAREVCSFVRDGMSAAEPVLVAVPGRRLDLVRGALGETGEAVSFADMAVLGRNPARIIPAVRRFADSRRPRRTRFVGEHVWAGRSAA